MAKISSSPATAKPILWHLTIYSWQNEAHLSQQNRNRFVSRDSRVYKDEKLCLRWRHS